MTHPLFTLLFHVLVFVAFQELLYGCVAMLPHVCAHHSHIVGAEELRAYCLVGYPQLAGARFQVLFHPAVRGAFHLSLTVLVRYRSPGSV